MKDEYPHRGSLLQMRELKHGDVAVRVPSSEERAPAGAAPDADRLLRAVVEIFRCRRVGDRSALPVTGVRKHGTAADHALPGDAVHLLADRSHEVASAA